MKTILFTHSYFLHFDPKQLELQQAYPPLGTLYAAALMESSGYQTTLFDSMFVKDPNEIITVLERKHPDYLVIYDDGFNYLTKMCLTNMREAAGEMIRRATERDIPVIVCSSDASDHIEKYLDAGAHFVIRGEGEITLKELIDLHASGNNDFSKVAGISFRIEGKTKINEDRKVLRSPDELPSPAWHLVDMAKYKKTWLDRYGYFSLNISTTRGCPFHCNWCAKPIYGNRYNVHSPERIASDIRYLIDTYQADHFWITDDIFGLKPGWVSKFYQLVKADNLRFRYKIQSRVDLLLQENTIQELAASGCETIWVGAESGSQKILDAMDKGTTVEQIRTATRLMKANGIRPAFFLQFGYPGETLEDIKATIEMLDELQPDDIGISVSYPLPGTVFYERVKNDLLKKSNWTHSDDLAMMYQSTYPAALYKLLQRYVHRYYRSRQGWNELKELLQHPSRISGRKLKRIGAAAYHLTGSWLYKRRMDKILEAPSTSNKQE